MQVSKTTALLEVTFVLSVFHVFFFCLFHALSSKPVYTNVTESNSKQLSFPEHVLAYSVHTEAGPLSLSVTEGRTGKGGPDHSGVQPRSQQGPVENSLPKPVPLSYSTVSHIAPFFLLPHNPFSKNH